MVGRNYKAPDFIDSRMLEPKHAFRQDYEIEGGLTAFVVVFNFRELAATSRPEMRTLRYIYCCAFRRGVSRCLTSPEA